MAALRADVETVKKKRGQNFVIDDAQPYLDAVQQMKPIEGQSAAVFSLHTESVKSHFDILRGLTKTIRPEDDPFFEHYQTPVILEILCKEDATFAKSVQTFIQTIGKSEALIGRESARWYGGFYGPTCVVDFALIPGSTSNIVNRILQETPIPDEHESDTCSKIMGHEYILWGGGCLCP